MNREEIRAEIARLIEHRVPKSVAPVLAETILVFLEDSGFDTEASLAEREGRLDDLLAERRKYQW